LHDGSDRQLALEQFVFHWLAFEALAGDEDVASHCPACQKVVEHCGRPVTHRSSNKVLARGIFRSANPGVTATEFNQKVWGKARNSVFHGSTYPQPTYLFELKTVAEQLHRATDLRIAATLGLDQGAKTHHNYEAWYRLFLFVEWRITDAAAPFAADWPAGHLSSMAAEDAPGEAYCAAEKAGINLLDYQTASPDW
jgi:hypothetical protein